MILLRGLCLIALLAAPASSQELAERLSGHLQTYLPISAGAFPAILAVPGCSGVSLNSPATDRGGGSPTDPYFRRHYPRVAEDLREQGYAVFLLDYQSAEGVVSACNGEVTSSTVAAYVVAAVRKLAEDRRIDPDRVFVIGWSLGGAGVLEAIDSLARDRSPVTAIIAIYPRCVDVPPWSSDIPVHLFLGDADDITPAETCRSLTERLDPALPMFATSYGAARHGFDVVDAPASISTGRGTTVGYNRAAAEATWDQVHAILSGR